MKRIKPFIFVTGIFIALMIFLHLLFPLKVELSYSKTITDGSGEIIHAFLTPDEKWRMETSLPEISDLLKKTIIAKEDKYFYYHPGVNPGAILRAAAMNLVRGKRTSGASTITMQVARALNPGKRSYTKKLTEMFRAIQLELRYSKEEILQIYLNLVPYGGNIEGVKSASLLYFKKNPDHLSLAEITALSIIPNRPSSLVIGRHNAEIVKERNKWLRRFASEKLFTQKEIADALEEPLNAERGTVPRYIPHLAAKLKNRAETNLQTYIDPGLQIKTEKLVQDHVRASSLKNITNAAVIIMDNNSGQVITYVGSADFHDAKRSGQVNGAKAIRQPGSTLKPLVYALAIDEGILTPAFRLTDVATNYNGYSPENYDRNFNGLVSVEYALAHSLNIPAVRTLQNLGLEDFIHSLSRSGFQQIQKDQRKLGLSIVLGGCGASLEELTGLYSAFAREGVYMSPLYTAGTPVQKQRLISTASAYMITEMLSKANRPDFPINWSSTERMPKIAWKTGTSYGRRDGWSIGYNRKYTVGVWCGNFSGEGAADLSGANTATPLLFKIFNTIDYDSDESWFKAPDDCDFRMVCSETGMVPAAHCRNIIMDEFIPMVSSTAVCNNMAETAVSADEKYSYCKSCMPLAGYKLKIYPVISAEMRNYYQERNIIFRNIPAHNPDCEMIFKNGAPSIIAPKNGHEYLISKSEKQPLMLECRVSNDVNRIHWYINNRYYKSSDAGTRQFFMPEEGKVKISCTDDKGRNRDVWIDVKFIDL